MLTIAGNKEDPLAKTAISSSSSSQRRRLRSWQDALDGSPLRKSHRVGRDCAELSESLRGSSEEIRLSGTSNEILIWDPTNSEQLRAVKEALHVSTPQKAVVCREDEQDNILEFCKKSLKEKKAGSMYVCGCPGTGKSLSVDEVKNALINWANEENIQTPGVVSINCTSVTNTSTIFSKILGKKQALTKQKGFASLEHLQKLYSQKQVPEMNMILVIVDELDYLFAKDRAAHDNLFTLTTLPFSKCILIGIANTIDLISKLRAQICNPVVIRFCAYSMDQIISILQERLGALPYEVFQPQALELCAKKVAAVSGDMRKALSVCRSAVEILEAEKRETYSDQMSSSFNNQENKRPSICENRNMVTVSHVAAALSRTFKSPVVNTIQSLPLHQQVILCSALKLFKGEKKDASIDELSKCYVDVCKATHIPPVTTIELLSMCKVLEDQGILQLRQSKKDKLKRVTLKVDEADIAFVLQGIRFFRNCLQDKPC